MQQGRRDLEAEQEQERICHVLHLLLVLHLAAADDGSRVVCGDLEADVEEDDDDMAASDDGEEEEGDGGNDDEEEDGLV